MAEQRALVTTRRGSLSAFHRAQQVGGGIAGFAVVGLVSGSALGAIIAVPVIVGILAGLIVLAKRQAHRFIAENQIASDALRRRELATAREIWAYWSQIRNNKRILVIARHNLAMVDTQEGQLEEARRIHIEDSGYRLKQLEITGLSKLNAACAANMQALLGDLAGAEHWIAVAQSRKHPLQAPNADAIVVWARVIVALRQGKHDDAAKLLDDHWTMIEGRVPASAIRGFRLLRAFTRSVEGPREAGRAHEDLAATRPVYPNEFSYLGTAWPEMKAFLAANDY